MCWGSKESTLVHQVVQHVWKLRWNVLEVSDAMENVDEIRWGWGGCRTGPFGRKPSKAFYLDAPKNIAFYINKLLKLCAFSLSEQVPE